MKSTRLIQCFVFLALAVGVVSANGQAAAPVACPWLTQGMAARVLDGDVTVDVHVSDAGEGVCSFIRKSDTTTSLKLEVSKTALPACGADAMKLKGIGNEALRCNMPATADRAVEQISGRVRDRFFTLTMSHGKSAAASPPGDLQNDDLEQAAESVAGNLF